MFCCLFSWRAICPHCFHSENKINKNYTPLVHWTHLFTYSTVLPRLSCQFGETVYLWGEYNRQLTLSWHSVYFNIDSFVLVLRLYFYLSFLHLSLSSHVYILLNSCLISSLPTAIRSSSSTSSQLSSRIQMSLFFPTGKAANNLIFSRP